jgi:hypothetical protein
MQQEGADFGLQPTLIGFMIFHSKVIEKVENIKGLLHYEYGRERRSGAKVAL